MLNPRFIHGFTEGTVTQRPSSLKITSFAFEGSTPAYSETPIEPEGSVRQRGPKGPDRPAEAAAQPPSEDKGGLIG